LQLKIAINEKDEMLHVKNKLNEKITIITLKSALCRGNPLKRKL